MSNVPWLTAMLVIPLVGSLLVACLPSSLASRAKHVALGFSLVTLVVGIVAGLRFDTSSAAMQLVEQHQWIPSFGVSYALGVDGIALTLILMSLVLAPVCILAAWHDVPEGGAREKTYFALLLSLVPFMVGVFAATDVFLFYVFFEAMLVPVYFLVAGYGGRRRRAAALKFLLFSLAGGLVMLVALIGLYVHGPGGADGFLVTKLVGLQMTPMAERLMFLGFFIAFAIKAPMWPVHTWLPDTAEEATPATSTLLVGVLDKIGTFGMLRFCLPLFPEASRWAAPVVMVLALVSVFYGAFLAIGSKNMLRLVSYTSISHFGFIVLGIFAFTVTGGNGAALYMVNHGFSTAALFLIVGMLIRRRGSAQIPAFGGWQRVTPALAGCFLVAGLSGLALPPLASFVSEYLVLIGTFQRHPVIGAIAALGVILAALYILLMYQRVFTGPRPDIAGRVRDLTGREKLVVAPLIASFLVLGFWPRPALDAINPAITKTLQTVGVADPAPAAGAQATSEGSAK
ncbi:NADH-quinone oxidoreductase subunit M [Arsenicicoccus sp. oral taxon 190]|uniref:NADH-quinone oxidoreductase subunit M n=1 Tax=Arsenicicoccus sp. oral taxon 190 TaxID=1658671 RepID=UPI00067A147A|nr:NADH-quinone oxidoreductase subunit M [Arsenicicoccus sp. oral taxon 190]AKT51236.1 NADH:ubiquinone oxidoreductase subunit M [Arsenicicoccus sp. oral taxon 190]